MKNNITFYLLFLFMGSCSWSSDTPTPLKFTPAWINGKRPPAANFYITPIKDVRKELWNLKPSYIGLSFNERNKNQQLTQIKPENGIKTGLYQIRWKENERDREDWFTIEEKHLKGFVLKFRQKNGAWRVVIEVKKQEETCSFDWSL